MSSTLEYRGLRFTVTTEPDLDTGPPWEDCDGHGVVTDWVHHDSEQDTYASDYENPLKFLVLSRDHGSTRYYDVQASLRKARAEQWGLSDKELQQLRLTELARTGQEPSADEIRNRAMLLDYQYLRGWCQDDWRYVGVVVTLQGTTIDRSLWGVEDSNDAYIAEVARELADQIIHEGEKELDAQIAKLQTTRDVLKAVTK